MILIAITCLGANAIRLSLKITSSQHISPFSQPPLPYDHKTTYLPTILRRLPYSFLDSPKQSEDVDQQLSIATRPSTSRVRYWPPRPRWGHLCPSEPPSRWGDVGYPYHKSRFASSPIHVLRWGAKPWLWDHDVCFTLHRPEKGPWDRHDVWCISCYGRCMGLFAERSDRGKGYRPCSHGCSFWAARGWIILGLMLSRSESCVSSSPRYLERIEMRLIL